MIVEMEVAEVDLRPGVDNGEAGLSEGVALKSIPMGGRLSVVVSQRRGTTADLLAPRWGALINLSPLVIAQNVRYDSTVPILENPRHEAFAQARAQGMTADAAYASAGLKAHRGNAHRLSTNESVRARVAELQEATAEKAEMTREQAVKMCVEILRSPPSAADLESPLCELKMGKDGPYAVFPDKKGILDRLAKMLGWDEPEKHDITLTGPQEVLAGILKRKKP